MRKDSIFLLLPAGLFALLGIALVVSASLSLLPASFNNSTAYFLGGSLFTIALILFIAAFTTPLKIPVDSTSPEETAFFEEFKIKYKIHALKAYLINLGIFALIMLTGVSIAILMGIESVIGIFTLVSTLSVYFYTAWVFLPKHLVYTCPSCNIKSLSCSVLLLQHGSNIKFECKECSLKVNWNSGVTNLNPKMALKFAKKNLAGLGKNRCVP